MKKLLLIAATIVATGSALAQGTVNFNNKVTASSINAPVFGEDGRTRLAGPDWLVQLWAGVSEGSLAPVGAAVPFRTGAASGYFSDRPRTIPASLLIGGTPAGGAVIQIRVWAAAGGPNWDAALASGKATGKSYAFMLTGLGDPNAVPPTTPKDLIGLTSFALCWDSCPEPSSTFLVVLGAGALLLWRWRGARG